MVLGCFVVKGLVHKKTFTSSRSHSYSYTEHSFNKSSAE